MSIQTNLLQVHARITSAAIACQRLPQAIKLLAVSKMQGPEKICAAIEAGQLCFGENYLQAALPKIKILANFNLEWHFIGAIQSNKTKLIAENFAWVHSIDRDAVVAHLARHRPLSLPPLNICVQVNVDNEVGKAGVRLDEVAALAKKILVYRDRICLRGLMAIPQVRADYGVYLASFMKLQTLWRALKKHGFLLDTLSMGMSSDLELAIQAGSTLVRVGTDIFGQRD